jgi:5'-3' exonuclease
MTEMKVHLVDGTYELFRHFYAMPRHVTARGEEVAAVRGVLGSLFGLVEGGATHVAIATDHVIESFRNELWPEYKDGSGIDPDLWSQFPLLENALRAAGFVVWAMVEYEADDALAAGAAMYATDSRVEQVVICTPDKDLAQCVRGSRVVQYDRRQRREIDEAGVVAKFGVPPASIPDYLALVGDSADGYPGIPGWGARSAATLLARYGHLENIPDHARRWEVSVRGADRLAQSLKENRELVMLFRKLATLVTEGPVKESVDDLKWDGPPAEFVEMCARLEMPIRQFRIADSARFPSRVLCVWKKIISG